MNLGLIFAKILENLYSFANTAPLAIACWVLISTLLCGPVIVLKINNMLMNDIIEPECQKIKKSRYLNSSAYFGKIRKTITAYGYTLFAGQVATLMELLMGCLLVVAYRKSALLETQYLFFRMDVRNNLRQALNPTSDEGMTAMVFFLGMFVIQYIHDSLMQKDLAIDESKINLCLNGAVCVIAFFMPCSFACYWFTFELLETIALIMVTRIFREHFRKKIDYKIKKIVEKQEAERINQQRKTKNNK